MTPAGRASLSALVAVTAVWLAFWWPALAGTDVLFLRDLVPFAIPSKTLLLQRLAAGEVPLWTPQVSAGMPYLADPAHQVFYPLNLVVAASGDVAVGLSRFIAAHLLIGMAAFVWLARVIGVGMAAATWGGLIYGLCGYNVSITDNVTYVPAVAWVPLLVAAMLRCGAHRGHVATAAIALAMLVFTGDLPDAAIATAFAMVLAAHRALAGAGTPIPVRWRPLRLLAVAALGVALAAVQIAPTSEMLALSVRAIGLSYAEATTWSLPPPRLLELLQPHLFGAVFPAQEFAAEGLYPVNGSPWSASIYLGWVPLALAAVAARYEPARAAIWLVLLVVALLLGFGRHAPYYPWLLDAFPVFSSVRYPEKYVFWVSFAVVVLACLGAEAVSARAVAGCRALRRVGALRVLALVAVAIWAALYLLVEMPDAVWTQGDPSLASPFWSARFGVALSSLHGLLAHTALLLAAGVFAVALAWTRPRVALAMLMAVAVADLWWMHRGNLPVAPAALFAGDRKPLALTALESVGYREGDRVYVDTLRPEYLGDIRLDPLAREIAAAAPADRYPDAPALGWIYASMLQRERLRPNAGVAAGVHQLNDDYTPLRPLANETFEQALLERAPGLLMSLSSVRWVVAHDALREELWDDPALREVYRDPVHHLRILEVRDPLPFARLVTGAYFVPPGGVVGAEARASGIDHRREALIERAEPRGSLAPTPQRGTLIEVARLPEHMVFDVESTAERAFLVINETYFPGWEATVAGRPATVERANLRFMAVEVPRGQHRVELRYRSTRLTAGAAISGIALIVVLGVALAGSGGPRQQ